ncbi:hypothetical protein BU16DRAFT_612563 [Lophium mytilinum]|uniref:Uncharacterized protein n=1 Tax=Lophium mytilinum TaxID=390894 RepID=A0A6A6RF07_9PEZI|nr:hypothetical protein BU16DRAFT_612563 [Lophium mytilinum]
MASGATAPPYLNGASPASVEERRWTDFYAKLFELRDEVFAGKHPRIKLPASVLEQVAPRPPQNNSHYSYSSRPTTNGTPNGAYAALPTPPRYPDNSSLQYQPGSYQPQASNGQRSFNANPASSIDPVLLTKSDDLVRAELQLKRQRVERVLKDQVDKKAHFKDIDAESRLDVDGLLAEALQIVKPVSGLPSATNRNSDGNGSDSVDENSYYSSQVNSSWSSDENETPQKLNNGADAGATNLQGTAPLPKSAAAPSKVAPTSLPTPHDEEPYEPADDIELYEPPVTAVLDDEDDESDYSPPPAADTFVQPRSAKKFSAAKKRRERHQKNLGSKENGGKNSSRVMPIIAPRGAMHIVAPQPARVSPLAYAKLPRMDQPRRNSQSDNGRGLISPRTDDNRGNNYSGLGQGDQPSPRISRRQSPAGPQQNIHNPKKRRREVENGKGRAGNKRVALSPELETEVEVEPYIKEEPMSPPPLAASTSDSYNANRRPLRQLPDDVEIVSARDARPPPVYYREQDPLPRTYRQMDEPASPSFVRVPSRTTHRQVDDQDLRRVASLQYARRPYSPSGPEPVPYSPTDVRHVRAASNAFNDRLAQQSYRQASVRPPADQPRYIRDRSRSPVTQEYLPRAHTPQAMAPPPRQIVVDQYGNKYYASPVAVDPRASMAPPSRRVEVDPYERAVTREPLMRAPVRIPDPYDDGDDHHRMPPPPLRRYVEPEVEMIEPRSYRQRGFSMRPAEPEYLPMQEPLPMERRPVAAYEEMGPPPREYASRSFSVRPEPPVRREAPGEYITRHESVQPGLARRVDPAPQRYREVSMVPVDPYAAGDDRRYAYAAPPPPQRRYLDEQDRPIEVAHDPYAGEPRRVSYRY